jgi:hypothetical protein
MSGLSKRTTTAESIAGFRLIKPKAFYPLIAKTRRGFDQLMRLCQEELTERHALAENYHVGQPMGWYHLCVHQRFRWSIGRGRLMTSEPSHKRVAANEYVRSLIGELMRCLPARASHASRACPVTVMIKRYLFPPGGVKVFGGIRGHRDGCEYLFTQLLEVRNISGGENQILSLRNVERPSDIVVDNALPTPLAGYIVWDQRRFHRLCPISVVDTTCLASRSVLIVRLNDDDSADL